MANGGPGLKRILDAGGLFSQSTEITGDTTEQSYAHKLKYTPDVVIVTMTDSNSGAVGGLVEGTHDATNVKVTAPTGVKYKIFAA